MPSLKQTCFQACIGLHNYRTLAPTGRSVLSVCSTSLNRLLFWLHQCHAALIPVPHVISMPRCAHISAHTIPVPRIISVPRCTHISAAYHTSATYHISATLMFLHTSNSCAFDFAGQHESCNTTHRQCSAPRT